MTRTDEYGQPGAMGGMSTGDAYASDESLVSSVLQDSEAFATLYRRYVGQVYAYTRRRVATDDQAEEIVADVFEAALAGLARFRGGPGGFRAWLFGIARHKVVDSYRARESPHEALVELVDDAVLEDSLMQRDDLQQLQRLVQALPDWEREALLLHFWDGLSWREVAAVTGKSEGAVKVAMHRTMKKLRQRWEEGK